VFVKVAAGAADVGSLISGTGVAVGEQAARRVSSMEITRSFFIGSFIHEL